MISLFVAIADSCDDVGVSRRASVCLILLFVATACTAKESGPTLWTRGCKIGLAQVDANTPEELAHCEQSMRAHPEVIADDIARCMVEQTKTTSPDASREALEACIGPATRAHLDKIEASHLLIRRVAEQLETHHSSNRSLPARLGDLPGVPTRDPWGADLLYEPGADGGFELCVLGADAKPGTPDDICYAAPFIFFQF
jgi:hypothetical protein